MSFQASSGPIVLVGIMGAGKTTVGRRLAQGLGRVFYDVDEEIERRTGSSIADLFQHRGEAAFRGLERDLTAELTGRPGVVVASGGGWIAQPGSLSTLPPGAIVIWLRVTANTVVRRVAAQPGERPLLAGPDPAAATRALLQQREPFYRQADVTVDTNDRTPDEVVREIIERIAPSGVSRA